jgi:TrpR family trp operon transcriptional repressor
MSKQKHFPELCEMIAEIKNPKAVEKFLEDILTPQEREVIAERLQIIKLLKKGHTQRAVAKKLSVSVSKVTRGAHVLKYGSGAFEKL